MNRVPNTRIRELYGAAIAIDEMIDETVLRWFGHIERMKNDRVAKRVYVEDCVGSCLVGRPQKRGIDSVNDCLK